MAEGLRCNTQKSSKKYVLVVHDLDCFASSDQVSWGQPLASAWAGLRCVGRRWGCAGGVPKGYGRGTRVVVDEVLGNTPEYATSVC